MFYGSILRKCEKLRRQIIIATLKVNFPKNAYAKIKISYFKMHVEYVLVNR